MKAKEYARVLEKLMSDVESEESLSEKTRGFLAYVKEKNNTPLLGKIVQELERKWQKDIRNIHIETGRKSKENDRVKERVLELVKKKDARGRVTESINPRLISGVKITVDDNYRVEASLEGALNQMFNNHG
ncbi:MAG: F0F1 ATP synthase subunit delta [Candidatus Wolfebacteria bacterium]|nr:F0F1 ATP synthase subunit delta [Candidatus Wolfebacteria bacterium]MDP2703905.1 F0F1 ATP synthase subunit delta [bacterium]